MPEFQASVELPQTLPSVFDFVRRPGNLVKMLAGTTQDLEFLVPEVLDAGSVLEFCMRRYGMKIEVQLEVVELIDQQRIFLQQTKGPFQRWFHEYSFMSVDDNRTKLTERIFFEPPSGFLGIFITGTGTMKQLHKRISKGHHQLKEQVGRAATS